MDESIRMEAIFGDGSGRDEGKGLMGKMLGAGKIIPVDIGDYNG